MRDLSHELPPIYAIPLSNYLFAPIDDIVSIMCRRGDARMIRRDPNLRAYMKLIEWERFRTRRHAVFLRNTQDRAVTEAWFPVDVPNQPESGILVCRCCA